MEKKKVRKQRGKHQNPEQSPKTEKHQRPKRKRMRKGDCELQRSRRGRGERERGRGVEVGATKSFFALEEGRIACHPTRERNPITRLRLSLVNDNSPSWSFFLVLCSRMMGCKFIVAPMETASEQQSFP